MGSTPTRCFTGASCMRRDSLRAQLRSRPGILERMLCGCCLSASTKVRNAKPRGATAASTAEYTAGSDALPGTIELTLARGQVRIAGTVDAGTLRTVLRCLLA